jgi:gluconate 2-dehydrogenase gamma chain
VSRSGDLQVPHLSRRAVLAAASWVLVWAKTAHSAVVKGAMPWTPGRAAPPTPVEAGPWHFFTTEEGAAIEALVDRLIAPDPETPGGKDAGCAVYIDRQLAGPYGSFEDLYMSGPFHEGTKQQGPQSPIAPKQHYRQALAALDKHCRSALGSPFVRLPDARKDEVIKGLEDGSIKLEGANEFFKLLLNDTQQGFFADPVYGGNRNMAAWKMIGFPGARYDYRDLVDRHNENLRLDPVGIGDHPDWKP